MRTELHRLTQIVDIMGLVNLKRRIVCDKNLDLLIEISAIRLPSVIRPVVVLPRVWKCMPPVLHATFGLL